MKKLFLSMLPLILLLLVGCDFTSSGSEFDWESKDISFNALSSTVDTIHAGDSVTVKFAFKAEEYISEENVSIKITNSNGSNMQDLFKVTVPDFYANEATLYSGICSFTIVSNFFIEEDYYRVAVTLTLGSQKATKVYYIIIGDTKPVAIDYIDNLTVKVGELGYDTIYAKISNGPHLTTADFRGQVSSVGGTIPEIRILSFENDSLALEIMTGFVVSGVYDAILEIPRENISKAFSIEVTDVQFPQISWINNITLEVDESAATKAKILYGDDVDLWDFSDIEIDSAGSTTSFPSWPEAEVISYDEATGIAIIDVDAWEADPGIYTGTLKIGESSKSFTITVEDDE